MTEYGWLYFSIGSDGVQFMGGSLKKIEKVIKGEKSLEKITQPGED